MDLPKVASSHFASGRVMQLATLNPDGHPRVNSVYYVATIDNKTVYWMSEPDRRHSIDSMRDNHIAGAVAVKTDHPVIGLQFTGIASEVMDLDEIKSAVDHYNEKYDGDAAGFYERFQAQTNKHRLYKMTIATLELFDEVSFPEGSPLFVPIK